MEFKEKTWIHNKGEASKLIVKTNENEVRVIFADPMHSNDIYEEAYKINGDNLVSQRVTAITHEPCYSQYKQLLMRMS